ncbi:hypothetical protein ACFONG_01630 [Uliginosibacterium paludis]|uniref:MarR family transcriptional regulator n=1 Tax=Uliginosibacterium paludis TaxID=1615952 RepID=A0ABV2CSY2_9RHOO
MLELLRLAAQTGQDCDALEQALAGMQADELEALGKVLRGLRAAHAARTRV